jgi:hypothetical protein
MIDIVTVGAAAAASLDRADGGLKVGPRSAAPTPAPLATAAAAPSPR